MSVFINAAAVNEAGKDLFRAHSYHMMGDETQAAMRIKQARARLYEESKWQAPGRDYVQGCLDLVIMIDERFISLDALDLRIPAEMVYFKADPQSQLANRKSQILQRVA
ncbi:MAG: hypothetical protein V2A34_02565 [Lentisphaerota bacterium]